jgi:anaphase-promoting complex subunit 6
MDGLSQLRCLVQDCLAKHMHGSAVFFANKLTTLASHPEDVLLLAEVKAWLGARLAPPLARAPERAPHHPQAYYASGQYHRALLLLRQTGVIEHTEALYLAARCYAECREWEECLALLGEGDEDEAALIEVSGPPHRSAAERAPAPPPPRPASPRLALDALACAPPAGQPRLARPGLQRLAVRWPLPSARPRHGGAGQPGAGHQVVLGCAAGARSRAGCRLASACRVAGRGDAAAAAASPAQDGKRARRVRRRAWLHCASAVRCDRRLAAPPRPAPIHCPAPVLCLAPLHRPAPPPSAAPRRRTPSARRPSPRWWTSTC